MTGAPAYIALHEEGILEHRIAALRGMLTRCTLCPHRCGVDRTAGERGNCGSGERAVVSSVGAHFGEEACLVGRRGSGTIFFTNCNLSCIFCQNHDISHLGRGEEMSADELAAAMLMLQAKGCHNINLVTPTHMTYAIVSALPIAVKQGLHIPLVYNCGGYESVETLEILNGIVDIYMPDFKYMNADTGERLSGARDYPGRAIKALREMYRQVGDLAMDETGVAYRGLLVRHLVLPNNLASTERVMAFLASLSSDTYINVMAQYRPEYRARECLDLRRRPTLEEYDQAVAWARGAGLTRLDRG